MARGAAARPRHRPLQHQLPDADAGHVRVLRARAPRGAKAAGGGARGRDRRGGCDPAARAASDLPGRVRLPRVRPAGRRARARPVHARRRGSPDRPGVQVHRLAVSALAVRTAVHPAQLRARTAGAGGRAVGVQGDRRRLEPRRGRADRARRRPARALRQLGDRVRRPEPGAARAGDRRSAQRHTAVGGARLGFGADGRRERALGRRRGRAGGGGRGQGHRRARAAVPDSGLAALPRARTGGTRCGRRAARGRTRRRARLRRARPRLPQCHRRATAARGDAQLPRGDRAAGGPERYSGLVAPPLRRRLHRGPRLRAVAHGARRRLARSRRLEHDRAARFDRVAVAVVRDLGAAASGRQR
jgi:hypothetical protein